MEKPLVVIDAPELSAIEPSRAAAIRAVFEPMAKMLEGFEAAYSNVIEESEKGITKETAVKARRLRLDIGKIRTEAEKLRKSEKEEYLRAGKAIDGVSNILKWAVTEKENKLEEIEKHQERAEQARRAELQRAREIEIEQYLPDAHDRDLASMDNDVWAAYYSAKKKDHEDRIEAERKAEEERIAREKAEAEERERIRKENERLKAEAEAREAAIEKERIAREKAEKAEQAKREELEARIKAKEEAERKAKAEAEAREQAELAKGDAAKVADLIADLTALKSKYTFKSAKNRKMYGSVGTLLDKVVAFISPEAGHV